MVAKKFVPRPISGWDKDKQQAWTRDLEYCNRTGQPPLKPEVWSEGYDLRVQHFEIGKEAEEAVECVNDIFPEHTREFPDYAPGAVRKKSEINASVSVSDVHQMFHEELAALHKELNQLEERLRPVLQRGPPVNTTAGMTVPEEKTPDGAVPMVQSMLSLYAVLNQAVDRVMEYNNQLRI